MKQAHEQASNQIYSERNNRNTNTIDLHGLHVAEALQILKRELGTGGGKLSGEISILVGTGHHTKGSRTPSRLPRSVERLICKIFTLPNRSRGVFVRVSYLKIMINRNQINAKIKHSKQKEIFRF